MVKKVIVKLGWYGIIGVLSTLCFFQSVLAEPTFLNRQVFPLSLSMNETGHFDENFLKTFEILTQWNNPTFYKVNVEITFTLYDLDSGKSQDGEDGEDDALMTVTHNFTIPDQVGSWSNAFLFTVIGDKLNQGYDHENEGAALELYVNAQISSVQHVDP